VDVVSKDLTRRVREALERTDIMALSTIGVDGPWTVCACGEDLVAREGGAGAAVHVLPDREGPGPSSVPSSGSYDSSAKPCHEARVNG
jgi:hypothetical protein